MTFGRGSVPSLSLVALLLPEVPLSVSVAFDDALLQEVRDRNDVVGLIERKLGEAPDG